MNTYKDIYGCGIMLFYSSFVLLTKEFSLQTKRFSLFASNKMLT